MTFCVQYFEICIFKLKSSFYFLYPIYSFHLILVNSKLFSAACVHSMTAGLPVWRCPSSLCVGCWWVGNGAALALIIFPSLSTGSRLQWTFCYVMWHFCGLTNLNVDYNPNLDVWLKNLSVSNAMQCHNIRFSWFNFFVLNLCDQTICGSFSGVHLKFLL
jgi:hypothetical protein